ncbi:MAG TPA: ABC transporter ATP-binding protein [Puia sp.]|nr:ABC transporter ATP-binding protein [Puia sp.]
MVTVTAAPRAQQGTLLAAHGLQTGYGAGSSAIVVARELPALELKAGRLVCLLGPNGSGKSTLLRTLAGLQPTLAGEITIAGLADRSPSALAKKISLVLTDRVRGNHLTVYTLVALGRYPYSGWLGSLHAADKAKVGWALQTADVEALKDKPIHTLSDGQYQKVMLARALAQDTPVLMLDEPTAHLDLPSRIRLMRLLHGLSRDTDKAILLSTHELDLALQIADEVWLLQSGGQLRQGTPEDLVLNGTFEAAFAEEDVVFDKEAGTFLLHLAPGKPIGLSGEGTALFWTERALRRAGFKLTADAPLQVRVRSGPGGPAWEVAGDVVATGVDSIEKLLLAIR